MTWLRCEALPLMVRGYCKLHSIFGAFETLSYSSIRNQYQIHLTASAVAWNNVMLNNLIILCTGIPDDKGLRSLVWRILLNYLPRNKNSWEETLNEKRRLYKHYIGMFIFEIPNIFIKYSCNRLYR